MDVELIANTTASLMRRRPAVTRDWRLVTLVVPLILPVLWVLARLAQTTAGSWSQLSAVILTSVLAGLFVVAATSLASAIVWRGGVMRLLGLELVTTAGRPASRGRVFVRTAVTWSPLLFPALVALWGKATTEATVSAASALTGGGVLTIATVSIVLLLAGAVFAINSPARGIQDRFAGTWIVPR